MCVCCCKVTVWPRQTVVIIVAVVNSFIHLYFFRFICVCLCCYERFWRCYFWLNWFFICQLDDSHQQLAASNPLNCYCCWCCFADADGRVGAHVWGWMENRWSMCMWRKKTGQATRTSGILLDLMNGNCKKYLSEVNKLGCATTKTTIIKIITIRDNCNAIPSSQCPSKSYAQIKKICEKC